MKTLDAFLDLIEKNDRASGSVLLYQNEKILYQRNFGSDIQDKNCDRIYRLASISKIYTATIVLKLIEEGLLSLQTSINDFFPEHTNFQRISIEHLLQHRSGIENYTNRPEYFYLHEKGITRTEKLKSFKQYVNHFSPGEKHSYSNTNYFLLSLIAEHVTKKELPEIFQEKIATPLNLKNTYFFRSDCPRENEVKSFSKGTNWIKESNTHHSITLGSGGVASTAFELAVFLEALMNGKLLNEESVKKMMEMNDNYGYGLTTFPFQNKKLYGHAGGIDGFSTIGTYSPDDKLIYIMLSNASAINTNLISIEALCAHYGVENSIPELERPIPLSESDLQKFIGDYRSDTFPLDVHFFINHKSLYFFPKNQLPVPLEYFGERTFKYMNMDIEYKFSEDLNQIKFTQYNLEHTYYRI